MANKLNNEEELYETIEKKKLQIPQEIRELLNHHLRNDTQVIMFGTEDLRRYLLELVQSIVDKQSEGEPMSGDDLTASLQELVNICDSVLIRGLSIKRFLARLNEATHQGNSADFKTNYGTK